MIQRTGFEAWGNTPKAAAIECGFDVSSLIEPESPSKGSIHALH